MAEVKKRRKKEQGRALGSIYDERQKEAIADIARFSKQLKRPAGWSVGHIFDRRLPLFPFFKAIEWHPARHFVVLGQLADAAQSIAFTLNPNFGWGSAAGGVGHAFYLSHLPFWDRRHLGAGHIVSTVLGYALVIFLAVLLAAGAARATGAAEQPPWVNHYKWAFLLVSGVGLVPCLQLQLSLMVCRDGTLWAHQGADCGSGAAIAAWVTSFFGAAVLILFTAVQQCVLFDSSPSSGHLLARAHSQADAFVLALRIATAVLYHHFLARGEQRWFCLFAALAFFAQGLVWIGTLPYYRSGMVQVKVTASWLACWTAVLAGILTTETGRSRLTDDQGDLFVLLVGAVAVALLSSRFYDLRVSRQFKADLELLREHGQVRSHIGQFPKGLEISDDAFPHHLMLVEFLLPPDEDDESSLYPAQNRDDEQPGRRHHFCTSYVSAVWRGADCELACRFLREVCLVTGSMPTRHMYVYATRLFLKGVVRFRESAHLQLHFAQYLYFLLHCDHAATHWLSILDEVDCSFAVRYQVWKLMQLLKVDNTYMERFGRAKESHELCLKHMQEFWALLQSEQVDKNQMNACALAISTHSSVALNEYPHALRLDEGDRPFGRMDVSLAVDYGLFFEQVLMSSEQGDRCFQVVTEFVTASKMKAMRGAKRKSATQQKISVAQLPQLAEARNAAGMGGENKAQMDAITGGAAIAQATRMLNGVFCFLVVLLLAFLLLATISSGRRKLTIRAVAAVGRARAHNTHAAVLVEELAASNPAYPPEDALVTPAQMDMLRGSGLSRAYKQKKLLGVTGDLHSSFNDLAWGARHSTFSQLTQFFTKAYLSFRVFYGNGTYSGDTGSSEHTRSEESVWSGTYKTLQVLYSFQNLPLAAMQPQDSRRQFVVENSAVSLAEGINRSALLYEDWNAEEVLTMTVALVGIFASSLVLIVCVFVLLTTRFRGVERTKRNVRDVVMLVPSAVMHKLERLAGSRLREFIKYKEAPERFLTNRRYLANQEDAAAEGFDSQLCKDIQRKSFDEVEGSPQEEEAKREAEPEAQSAAAQERLMDGRERPKKQGADGVGDTLSLISRVLLALTAMIAVAMIGLAIVSRMSVSTLESTVAASARSVEVASHYIRDAGEMETYARDFVTEGQRGYYKKYWEYYSAMVADPARRHWLLETNAPCCTPSVLQSFHLAQFEQARVAKDQLTAMQLRAMSLRDAAGFDETKYHDVLGYVQEISAAKTAIAREFAHVDGNLEPPTTRNITALYALSAAELVALSKQHLFSPVSLARLGESHLKWRKVLSEMLASSRDSYADTLDGIKVLTNAQLACGLIFLLCCLLLLARRWAEAAMRGFFFAAMLLVLILTLTTALLVAQHNRAENIDTIDGGLSQARECTEILQVLPSIQRDRLGYVTAFVSTGSLQPYLELPKLERSRIGYEERLSEMEYQQYGAGGTAFANSLQDLHEKLVRLERLENVSMAIAARYYNVTEVAELNALTWSEEDHEVIPVNWRHVFMADQYSFRSEAADTAPDRRANLLHIAERTIFAEWTSEVYHGYVDALQEATSELCGRLGADADSLISSTGDYFQVELALLSGALACVLLMYGAVLITFIGKEEQHGTDSDERQRARGKNTEAQLGQAGHVESLQQQIQKVAWALALVAVLISIIFIVLFVGLESSHGAALKLQDSSARVWQVADSMLWANRLAHDRGQGMVLRARLAENADALERFESRLFFFSEQGDNSAGYRGVGDDSSQDLLLFGPDPPVNPNYQSCNGTLDRLTQTQLAPGVSVVYREWINIVRTLSKSDPSNTEAIVYLVLRMREMVTPLMDGLAKSSQLYEEREMQGLDAQITIVMAIVLVSMALMVIDFFAIFRPLVLKLRVEETTTRLVLRLIPQEVRELPQIMELLEAHKGHRKDEKDMQVSEAVTEMSPFPLIAIDHNGIILKSASLPLKQYFGYSTNEVAGVNVKILMPERYAHNHDQYLANYRRTNQKRAIDRYRTVQARRKDGTEFPAEILVRQHMCSTGDKVFIGFVRDMTEDLELAAQTQMNNTVQEAAVVPNIIMDDFGTIIKVNTAALLQFGFSSQELVGENIKVLMPSDIAQNHDQYLANYKRTRVRRVIGTKTRQLAQKKNGETLPIEITVQEVERSDGRGSFYVGFVRDVQADEFLEQQQQVNDTVANMSTIPIVVIDIKGTVQRFSHAAERCWGYPASKVKGKNIKMLMPPAYADEHDGYLKRYAETRVRHVVGTTREVMGKKSSGQLIPLKLTICEIDKLNMLTFVGYAQDITEQLTFQREQEIATLVAAKSSIPILSINIRGEVLMFSAQAERDWQYKENEVLGQNVKMLMPPQFAAKHDNFLATYQRTGVKRVIDTTRIVTGMRRDRTQFPVEIRVNEIVVAEGDNVYIGYVRNLEDQQRLMQTFSVNEAVSEISPVPIIAINHVGIIQRFSRAAMSTWGYKLSDVVGQNVKKLMPPAIATHHDGYLQRYLKTGVKRVVDTVRRVQGVRRDGSEFPAELSVREVRKEGTQATFVAYARDCSSDDARARATQLGERICEIAITPLIVIDDMGIITAVNKATCEEFQWTEEEMVGRNIKMLQPTEVAVKHDKYLEKYRRTQVQTVVGATRRITAKRKDNSQFWADITVRESVKESVGGGGRTTIFLGYVQNVTEAMELEEAMRAVDVIVNLSSIPVVVIDSRGTIIKFSAAAEDVFGYTQQELLGKNVKGLMPPEIAAKHDQYLATYKRTGKKTVLDGLRVLPAKRKDGKQVSVEACIKEVVNQGRESVFVGYLRDARDDNAVRQEQAMVANVRDLSTAPIIMMDTQGTILEWNRAAIELFGYNDEDVIGVFNSITKLQPTEIAEQHQDFIDRYLKTGVKRVIDTVRRVEARTQGGARLDIEISVREMIRGDGSRRFLGFVRDLHERADHAAPEGGDNVSIGYVRNLEDQQRLSVNEAVSEISPVPVIAINHWNHSALQQSGDVDLGIQAQRRGRAECEEADAPCHRYAPRRLPAALPQDRGAIGISISNGAARVSVVRGAATEMVPDCRLVRLAQQESHAQLAPSSQRLSAPCWWVTASGRKLQKGRHPDAGWVLCMDNVSFCMPPQH
eukprot:TRINITY_DN2307_c0_g1_i11.p1 TRINITY_DN2307_c0_g1~~TRINITY_DN2307_c0_g1_i11.p1  ORF type:complete len:3089 (+),score=1104.57 TRINITY_DN2307_c0_g1_i11:166-9432(+)